MIHHNVKRIPDRYYILNNGNEFVCGEGFERLEDAVNCARNLANQCHHWVDDVYYIQITEQHGEDQYGEPKVDLMWSEYVIQINNGKVDSGLAANEHITRK